MLLQRFKVVPITLIALFILLQYRLWFEANGVWNLLHLKKAVAAEVMENAQLKQRNEQLVQEVQDIKSNQGTLEARARQELGMIKQDETFYQVVN